MQNKVVVITGASQGLGKELSLQLAKLGAKLALVARTEKLLQELKNKINSSGGVAEYFVCDVTDYNQVNSTVTKIIEKFGKIDVLINNAGIWTNDTLESKSPELIERAFLINSVGPIYFYKAVAPIFEKNNSGHFLFINSIASFDMPEHKDYAVYAATKWALTGFIQAIRHKYNHTNIKITSIHPGPISTNIDKAVGEDWHSNDDSWMMSSTEVSQAVIYALTAPGKLQIGSIELKNTNWNS
jgi:short-subunit dehydrogenase